MSQAAEAAAGAGMEEALHAERVASWKRAAERWLDEQPEGRLFTADDLVAAIGKPDVGQGRNNVVGAWINAQQRGERRIEFTGRLEKSSRVEGHGNLQRLWRVKDGRVGGDVGSAVPQLRAGVSSSPSGPIVAVSEEDEWEGLRTLDFPVPTSDAEGFADAPPGGLPDMGEQLGLLGGDQGVRGAYSGAA